jgi:hypothetical protein
MAEFHSGQTAFGAAMREAKECEDAVRPYVVSVWSDRNDLLVNSAVVSEWYADGIRVNDVDGTYFIAIGPGMRIEIEQNG